MTEKEHKTSRHAALMRGVVTPIFGLLAVACFVFGILNATEWKPNPQVDALASTGTRYVVTDPGMLSLVDDHVTMTVTSSDSSRRLCVASGLPHDITGWIAGRDYTRLTGLASWTEVSTASAKASGTADAADGAVAFDQSDMWQSVTCGTGSVTIDRDASSSGRAELIIDANPDAAADDVSGTPLELNLHWTRATLPDYVTPLVFLGGLLTVAAVLSASLFAIHPMRRRKKGMRVSDEYGVVHGIEHAEERVREEIKVTIPQLMFGAIGSFFGAIASMLHIGRPSRRRHARRAARTVEVSASASASVPAPARPTVVDVTARNMVAQTAAAHGSDAARTDAGATAAGDARDARGERGVTFPSVTEAPESAAPTVSIGGPDAAPSRRDEEATSVISMDELNAYIARLNAENAEDAAKAGDAGNAANDGRKDGDR